MLTPLMIGSANIQMLQSTNFSITHKVFEKNNVNVHVSEGAIRKDGLSTRITMDTALVSSFTGRKVRCSVGRTGEITLRGQIVRIGSVKEKLLATSARGTLNRNPAKEE